MVLLEDAEAVTSKKRAEKCMDFATWLMVSVVRDCVWCARMYFRFLAGVGWLQCGGCDCRTNALPGNVGLQATSDKNSLPGEE